jgi:general secretion pathway protein N
MMRFRIVLMLATSVMSVCGPYKMQAATGPGTPDELSDGINPGALEIKTEPNGPPNSETNQTPRSGNPLWTVPLRSLSETRERPIFSPSRRPPAPAVVAAPRIAPVAPPPKPPEPERAQLTLIGTVVSETERIGIFIDQTTKKVVRLRMGEAVTGWILRSLERREATLEKNRQTVTLALPAPDAVPAKNGPQLGLPPPPVSENDL